MTFSDLNEFCRLCLLPLNGSYIDCALNDHLELKDTIKMVYNIDIQTKDEYSTKVCTVCCDILLVNTIHYLRVVDTQKSLSRIQRIKNKLLGKKKADKKKSKQSSTDAIILNDVEMIEIEPNCLKTLPLDDYEMKETYQHSEMISTQYVPCAESQQQLLFGNLTSFVSNQQQQQQPQPTINDDVRTNTDTVDWLDEIPMDNRFDINDVLIVPPIKSDILDQNNNNCTTTNKRHPSFFQLAKRFYGNIRNMSMVNVERTLDEITKQLALLRFAPY